jgi:aspartate kinase
MSADPRLTPNAHTITKLSYREAAELAHLGGRVLLPKSIRPVIEAGINLRVLNTFNPSPPGTLILADPNDLTADNPSGILKAVTAIRNQRLVNIEGRGMLGAPGIAGRALNAAAAAGANVLLIAQASSGQSLCFAVPTSALLRVLSELESCFEAELERRDIDRIWATEEVAILTVVGAGLRHSPGVAGKIFNILGEHEINVIAIAQGAPAVSISLVVDALDIQMAMNAVHSLIQ